MNIILHTHTVWFLNNVKHDYSVLCCAVLVGEWSQHSESWTRWHYNTSKHWESLTQWQCHIDLNPHNHAIRPSWLDEWHNSFPRRLIGYCRQVVSILFCIWEVKGTPHILTEVSISLRQSLHTNVRLGLQIRPWPLPSTSFQIHYSVIIPSLDTTACAAHHIKNKWINKPKLLLSWVFHGEQFKISYLTSEFSTRWHDYLGCQWNSVTVLSLACRW
jgi:hypothetical protein